MNGTIRWVVAVVVVAAAVFYFWPLIMKAPVTTEQAAEQPGTQSVGGR